MGILGNLVNKLYTNVLDPFTTVVSHPIKSVQAIVSPNIKFSDVVAKTVAEPKLQQITEAITTGLAVGSVFGAAKAIATKGVATAAKALIPATTKGKVTAAVAVPVAAGVLTKTSKPIESIAKVPAQLTAFGADVGSFIDDPTLKNAEKILKENPGVSLAIGAGAVALGAGSIVSGIGAVENIKTRESVKELTNQLSTQPVSTILPTTTETKRVAEVPATTNLAPVSMTPQTPQTQVISSSAVGVRRRKRKSMRSPASINQRVNVIVSNRSIGTENKTYLKREIYA
jgi:hypothetical protein